MILLKQIYHPNEVSEADLLVVPGHFDASP